MNAPRLYVCDALQSTGKCLLRICASLLSKLYSNLPISRDFDGTAFITFDVSNKCFSNKSGVFVRNK